MPRSADQYFDEARQWGRDNVCGSDASDDIIVALCEMFGLNPDKIYPHARREFLRSYDLGLKDGGWR